MQQRHTYELDVTQSRPIFFLVKASLSWNYATSTDAEVWAPYFIYHWADQNDLYTEFDHEWYCFIY